MHWLNHILPSLQQMGTMVYGTVFLVSFLESLIFTGMFVPGTVVVIVAGGIVAQGYHSFWLIVLSSTTASILGDAMSYELGRRGKMHLERWGFLRKHIERARPFFIRHQKKSILLGRFIGPTRPVIPFVAGVADMSRQSYYPMNIASGLLWSLFYVSLGYVFGAAWKRALVVTVEVLLFLFFIFFLWSFVRWMLSKQ